MSSALKEQFGLASLRRKSDSSSYKDLHQFHANNKNKVDFDSPVSERNRERYIPLAVSANLSAQNFFQTMNNFMNHNVSPFSNNTPKINKFQSKVTPKSLKRIWTPKPQKKGSTMKRAESCKKVQQVPRLHSSTPQRLLSPAPSHHTTGTKPGMLRSTSVSFHPAQRLPSGNPVCKLFNDNSTETFNPTKAKPQDPEDLKHTLYLLKIDFNKTHEENLKLKTRNSQLENLITQLYNDLHDQKLEIQKIYSGKQAKPAFLQQSIASGLKRQLREERTSNKSLTEELELLKKSLKQTTTQELNFQLQLYQSECVRLRQLLEQELLQSQQSVVALAQNHFQIMNITSEEDKRRVLSQLQKKDHELKEALEVIERMKGQLDQQRTKLSLISKQKLQGDLQTRQSHLIRGQKANIKALSEKLSAVDLKIVNYDRVFQRNLDLTKQVGELTRQIMKYDAQQRESQDQSMKMRPQSGTRSSNRGADMMHLGVNLSARGSPGGSGSSRGKQINQFQNTWKSINILDETLDSHGNSKIKKAQTMKDNKPLNSNSPNVSSSPSLFLAAQPSNKSINRQQTVPQFKNTIEPVVRPLENQISLQVPLSFIKTTEPETASYNLSVTQVTASVKPLTNYELLAQGIRIFKSIVEHAELPQTEQNFYEHYEKDIRELYSKTHNFALPESLLHQVFLSKHELTPATLSDQIKELIHKWQPLVAEELQMIKLVIDHVIPCIKDGSQVDLGALWDRLSQYLPQVQLVQSSHSVKTDDQISEKIDGQDLKNREVQSLIQSQDGSGINQKQSRIWSPESLSIPRVPQTSSLQLEQESRISSKRMESKRLEERHPNKNKAFESQKYSSHDEHSASISASGGNLTDRESLKEALSTGHNSITEEQMLDTAESILSLLAQKLIQNGWSVHDVFGQPDEIIRQIPEYEGEHNIRVLTPQNFLGRVYQAGIQNLTQLEVACLMRVLGKPEFDDSVRYDELELLLENFGVVKENGGQILDQQLADQGEEDPNSENLQIMEDESPSVPENDLVHQQSISDAGIVFIDDKPIKLDLKKTEIQSPEDNVEGPKETATFLRVDVQKEKPMMSRFSLESIPIAEVSKEEEPVITEEVDDQIDSDDEEHIHLDMGHVIKKSKTVQHSNSKQKKHKGVKLSSEVLESTPKNEVEKLELTSSHQRVHKHKQSSDTKLSSDVVLQDNDHQETPTIEKAFSHGPQKNSRYAKAVNAVKKQRKTVLAIAEMLNEQTQFDMEEYQKQNEILFQSERSQAKDARQALRQSISHNKETMVFKMIRQVIEKQGVKQFIQELDTRSYKQVIKSKTRATETIIITQEEFLNAASKLSDVQLEQADLEQLQECVQLTPKFQHLFTMKLLSNLIIDIENNLRNDR